MRWIGWLVGLLAAIMAVQAQAQVPKEQLEQPPADARHFIISSTGGKHGDSWMWTAPDGRLIGRESMILRGQVWEEDSSATFGADGRLVAMTVRGVKPEGDAAETFTITNGVPRWTSPVDHGEAPAGSTAYYNNLGGPIALTAAFVDRLLAAPDRTLDLLPGGRAHAERLTALEVGSGPGRKTVTAWAITGLSTTPVPVWADEQGHFFGLSFFISWLPEGYEGDRARLDEAQTNALAAQMPALARRLAAMPTSPVAFTHIRLYDADAQRFLADQTVVVSGETIAAVGAADSVTVPQGAQIVDGRGMTLVPGLWDAHMHVGDDYTGIQELSLGVTSVRDPGNDDSKTIDRRERAARGELLMPNVYPSSLIDGRGPNTAQVANVATSEAEAIEWVRKAKEKGFNGVKFYGTMNPAWLPAAIAEAHRLGLHVHGHVPQGMRPLDAIHAGYDEITHINWVMMQAMPDSVIAASNGIARFEGPGRYAKDVDLDGPAISEMIMAMAAGHIANDPTAVTFEALYVPDPGELAAAYVPFAGTMPVSVERSLKTGGFAVPEGLTRADYRASFAKMLALVKKMHDADIPIVAGTDGSGIELIRELELYVEAGLTPAQALATATIQPARLLGVESRTGSIAVGKAADLFLVDGDPSASIGALRQTRLVMLGGRMMDADALRAAAGFSGRPK